MKRFVKWFLVCCVIIAAALAVGIILLFVASLIVGTTDGVSFCVVLFLLIAAVCGAIMAITEEDL